MKINLIAIFVCVLRYSFPKTKLIVRNRYFLRDRSFPHQLIFQHRAVTMHYIVMRGTDVHATTRNYEGVRRAVPP